MIATYDKMCLIGPYMRRNGTVKLSRELRNKISKSICKEFITKEREVNAVSVEHLRGYFLVKIGRNHECV